LLLSRVAENLYWSARYLERAEDTARIVLQRTNLIVDLPPSAGATWDALLGVTGNVEAFQATGHSIVSYLVDDRDNPSCLLLAVTAARDNLRGTREVIPRAAWQAVNDLYHFVANRHEEGVSRAGRARFCDQLISEAQRVVGVLSGTMSRDAGFEMLRLGRHIERADMTTRVLDVNAGALMRGGTTSADYNDVRWANVLRSLSALQMFRRATRGPVEGPAVVRFCLTDTAFPRSVAFCLARVEECLMRIDGATPVIGATYGARHELAVAVDDGDLDGDTLHDLADRVQLQIAQLHDTLAAAYFSRRSGGDPDGADPAGPDPDSAGAAAQH
jgi:uncharacterized alpha-E superfamily protein